MNYRTTQLKWIVIPNEFVVLAPPSSSAEGRSGYAKAKQAEK